jgi:diguanylate cyclase (GGDEF)-like protein
MPPSQRARVLILAAIPDGAIAALHTSSFGPFDTVADAQEDGTVDAVIVDAVRAAEFLGMSSSVTVIVTASDPSAAEVVDWLGRGAQDVIIPARTTSSDWPLRVRVAIERRRFAESVRRAVGIDLDTGLPDQQQLVEHMSHLFALRAREPAPMALLVLRVEGLATTQARLGREAAQVLRRKLAVRLRAGVRASDVVASLGEDRFGVLLVSMLSPDHAQHVAQKLLAALAAPFQVAGQAVGVAVAIGIGRHPADGDQAAPLLSRALSLAAAATSQGRAGFTNLPDGGAANDD